MKHLHRLPLHLAGLLPLLLILPPTALAQETVRVLPEATEELLINPGMGFSTFQHFNGDSLFPGMRWSEEGPVAFSDRTGTLENRDYPQTSIAYCRWYWDVLEPEKGDYNWELIDNTLLTAHRHNQTLHVLFMPQDQAGTKPPRWYREEANGFTMEEAGKRVWQPDYRDPKYVEHWGNMIRAFGARYDGHPWLEAVDLGALGYWGEWHTTGRPGMMPPWEIKRRLIDIYLESFKRTPLLMLIGDVEGMGYATDRGAGWFAACLGDLGIWGSAWNHHYDLYPQHIARSNSTDAWKKAPVYFETCGVYGTWYQKGFDVDLIHQEALRFHVTAVNAKSSAIPKEWMPKVEDFMKRMGYRLELRKLEYPAEVAAGKMMPIQMWWVNVGVAPPYRRYNLAIQLKNEKGSGLIRIDTNVTKWLPGDDVILEEPVWVPDLAPGKYRVSVGLLDPFTGKPAIKLSLKNRTEDNWHDLGEIELTKWELQ